MKLYFLVAFVLALSINSFLKAQQKEVFIKKNGATYLSNTVVVKIKERTSKERDIGNISNELQKKFGGLNIKSIRQLFDQNKSDFLGLDRIFMINYASETDPYLISSKLSSLEEIEWAEPKFVYTVDYIPNDPSYSAQYHLQKIKASDAWNISTGDTSIVIAIIDTGVDWDHPDLSANIWRNWSEIPDNGIDDDNNGFVDDIRGWDFGGLIGIPDNDPMEDNPYHGTHVAGDASAVTDNSVGIASIGFKSKIMPVKTTRDDYRSPNGPPYIVYGYEGIKYAADNGAQIINCSWGGGGYSILGQEVINYATALGALVVAAAGNNNSSSPFYPASYKNVFSVAATDEGDMKTYFSNFGADVDVSAPGINIYSTWQNDTYRYGLGTSFAAPIASGLAALVKSVFPNYNPSQIAEQIRTNCDDINNFNPGFVNQLGKGRINAHKCLINTNSKSVRAIDVVFLDEAPGGNGNGALQPGETVTVRCRFVNFLSPTTNLSIYLESSNNYSTVQNAVFSAGYKATLDTFTNAFVEFSFQISQNVPQNYLLTFNLNYVDDSYQDFQLISITANPTYATQSGNNVALTITSKGTLAFNDFPNNSQGDGFKFLNGPNLLFEGALMLATSTAKVSDAARGSQQGSVQNDDFSVLQPFILFAPGTIADVEGMCMFNDDNAGVNKLNVEVKLNSYSFGDLENENYILLKYSIKNTSSSVLNNLYAGLFFDWDFADAVNDFTAYDTVGNLGYAYRVGGNPDIWVATALVSSTDYGFWAINNQGGDGGFGIYDGFTDAEKWLSLSSGIGKPQAGAGDISHVISGGQFTIQPNEVIQIAFAIAAGFNLNDLRTAITNARSKYLQIPTSVPEDKFELPNKFYLAQNYPNPFNPNTKISWQSPVGSHQTLKIFDVLGNEVATLVDEYRGAGRYEINFDASQLASGIYYYRVQAGSFVKTKKMILMR